MSSIMEKNQQAQVVPVVIPCQQSSFATYVTATLLAIP